MIVTAAVASAIAIGALILCGFSIRTAPPGSYSESA
jgi:hypothetical protein